MSYTKEETDVIILSSFDKLTYNAKRALLSDFGRTSPDFELYENLLIKTLSRGVYNKVKADFSDEGYRAEILSGLERRGVTCVTYFSEDYPDSLRTIPTPPVLLYCKGDTKLLKTECFSIVGSRRTPPKTIADCAEIAAGAARAFTVVSGIAEGADAKALESALKAGGKVISVLANGFDQIYPAFNAELIGEIAKRGLLVSEYSPKVRARSFHFGYRNRIIAGLSVGTLVVSAGEKSGALITASYAFEYGRDVFAVPEYPKVPTGAGCNMLIKKGAALTENILDIYDFYGLDFKASERKPVSDEEQAVLDAVKSFGDAAAFGVAEKLGKPLYGVLATLTMLEMKGLVFRLGGNRFKAL